ncbi:hypothetical protein F4U94_17520 [Sphingobium limneticum]|jgi:hypothetical protein|uniref:Calcium-binding protein n=2 Tax=Sphingobium limneticum TaxID=1007511 RepID=A0A5J5HXK9_9SPHN|nr:hypothetical protein [Sphingobium limneticum]KAA9012888.1 hypothetical protein F4U94_17520 [Sphingobium limneticum]KAA9013465.1 hypothetical protein F4U96_18180 [Sphingobium limneticum]KAA9026527.1 hypothetical protein F4U95_18305 [Sphingobium limneticum]
MDVLCRKPAALFVMLCLVGCGEGGVAAATDKDRAAATPVSRSVSRPAPGGMAMGTNLDGLAYWSSAMPVLDLMKSASVWLPQAEGVYDTGEAIAQDRNGWPLLPVDAAMRRYRTLLVNILHDNPAALPAERYVVLYEGHGAITAVDVDGARVLSRIDGELHVSAGRGGSLYLRIDADGEGRDPIRNIRVVRADYLPLYRAGLTFDPEFLERIKSFHALRFMDWMNSNALFAPIGGPLTDEAAIERAPQLDWADRPRPTSMRWGEGSRGVPVEAMVELANRTGAEPWFTMPVNASDDYVRGFASYVHAQLRPDLKVHVELSNEVWNWIFPQARYARARARAIFGPDGDGLEWYGMRAAQVGMIWKRAFGEAEKRGLRSGRVAMVFGTQFGWRGLEATGLETRHWRDGNGRPMHAADYFDEYAITGYYDGTMNVDDAVPIVQSWWKDEDGGYGRAIAELNERITDFNAPLYQYHAGRARAHGLRLVSYESGFGEYTPISQHANQPYTDFLAKLQRRPEFKALETANYSAFAQAGGSLFMNFGIIGTPSKWGNWSALETIRQTGSPRYDALMTWLRLHPPSSARGPAIAYADARIALGGTQGETFTGTAHGYDVLVGGSGNDRFFAGRGSGSRIDGGGGHDMLVLPERRTSYRFQAQPSQAVVQVIGPTGVQSLTRISNVRFSDGALIDLARLVSEDRNDRLVGVKRVAGVSAPEQAGP